MTFSQPKTEEDLLEVKEEGPDENVGLLAGEIGAGLQNMPLTHHDGKMQGQAWSFKRSKVRRERPEGGRKGEGGSDSDSDSDSGSSSSDRSSSSDDSGESEAEAEGGELLR